MTLSVSVIVNKWLELLQKQRRFPWRSNCVNLQSVVSIIQCRYKENVYFHLTCLVLVINITSRNLSIRRNIQFVTDRSVTFPVTKTLSLTNVAKLHAHNIRHILNNLCYAVRCDNYSNKLKRISDARLEQTLQISQDAQLQRDDENSLRIAKESYLHIRVHQNCVNTKHSAVNMDVAIKTQKILHFIFYYIEQQRVF